MNNREKLNRAKLIALSSSYTNKQGRCIRIGAAIYDGNRLIASSVNKNKTHSLMEYYNEEALPFNRIPYLHAEIAALLKARWEVGKDNLNGMSIYIARRLNTNDGKYGLASPCPACRKALINAGIKKIVYTTNEGYAVEYIGKG